MVPAESVPSPQSIDAANWFAVTAASESVKVATATLLIAWLGSPLIGTPAPLMDSPLSTTTVPAIEVVASLLAVFTTVTVSVKSPKSA